jgi:rod shape-determining protein MreB
MGWFNFFTQELAIDLGTANTLIIHKDQVVVDEPSIIAMERSTGKVIAIGHEAMQMFGKENDNIKTIRPLKDGVIADFHAAEHMIRGMIKKINKSGKSFSPQLKMVICIPSGITEVEKRAVKDSADRAGGKEVYMIHEPMAAAVGIGIDVTEPMGNMVIDIGGGTTEVAVISLGGIVVAQSVRVAGDELDEAIVAYVRAEYSLDIGINTAEEIKIQMASAWPLSQELTGDVGGRDTVSGLPRTIEITSANVRDAIAEPIAAIIDAVKSTLDRTPPELAADIMDRGIYLSGGGALLSGMTQRVTHETGMPCYIAPDPLYAVAIGSGRALENIEAMRGMMSFPGLDQL